MSKSMALAILLSLFLTAPILFKDAHACTVCHSKDPRMVRMHEALEFKDCFLCHGPVSKRSHDAPQQQMRTDKLCVRCHGRTDTTGTR